MASGSLLRSSVLLATGVMLLGLGSCKKDSPAPCANASRLIPGFHIEEVMDLATHFAYPMENDSINGGGYIQFTALEETADEYEWQIGKEPNPRYGRQVRVLFEKVYGQFDVRLIVRKKSVRHCFPDAPSADTGYRSFWVYPYDTSILFGTYIGQNIGPIDQGTKADTVIIGEYNGTTRVMGLEESCSPLKPILRASTTYQIYLKNASNICSPYEGFGRLDRNTRTLTVDYTERDKNAQLHKHRFIGVKQP